MSREKRSKSDDFQLKATQYATIVSTVVTVVEQTDVQWKYKRVLKNLSSAPDIPGNSKL